MPLGQVAHRGRQPPREVFFDNTQFYSVEETQALGFRRQCSTGRQSAGECLPVISAQ